MAGGHQQDSDFRTLAQLEKRSCYKQRKMIGWVKWKSQNAKLAKKDLKGRGMINNVKKSVRDEWATPQDVVDKVADKLNIWGFDVDVCATKETAKAPEYFGPDHYDESRRDMNVSAWGDSKFIWCNPPFTTKSKWLSACVFAAQHKRCIVAFLAPDDQDLDFNRCLNAAADFIFMPNNRIAFIDERGVQQKSCPFYSKIAIITPWADRLACATMRDLEPMEVST